MYIGNGSSGNATYYSDGTTSVLIDDGLPAKRIPYEVNGGILLTHVHTDHAQGVPVYLRKYFPKTGIRCIVDRSFCAELFGIESKFLQYQDFTERFEVGTISVEAFGILHDQPCFGFLLSDSYIHITDTGKIPFTLEDRLKKYSIQVLYLECNYDEEMMENSEYDAFLRRRIRSRVGHLSNQDVLTYLTKHKELLAGVQHIVLGHLSENTNSKEMLQQRMDEILAPELHSKIIVGGEGTTIKL